MTTDTRESRRFVGQVGAVFGALALASVVWIGVLSFTSFDPPEMLRIAGSSVLPIGIGGALGAGFAGRRGASRPWEVLGLVLAAAAVAALTGMFLVVDY